VNDPILAAIEAELARREEVKTSLPSLADWCRQCGYEPAKHHLLLVDALEAVASGKVQRLAFFLPPGSAKSTYASVLFPGWFMARMPGASVIMASHTQELAARFGRRVRGIIEEHGGGSLGITLSPESQAAGRWALTSGGEYYAAGVGGAITGFRADLAIIDDPVRSREDADSTTVRDGVHGWYTSDLLTRLKPGGRVT
jgi:hypothetical protein